MSNPNDHELVRRAQGGAIDAFGALFERHARAIYNYCFRRTADWSVAEDLTSVVFLEAWRHRDVQLRRESALPWLLGVATNVLRNHRRSLSRHRAALARVPPPDPSPDHADDVAGRMDDEFHMRKVIRSLEQLSGSDQELLSLVVWGGLSYEEVAEILAIPVGTVKSRLSRARSRLRELAEAGGHLPGDGGIGASMTGRLGDQEELR